MTTTPQQLDTGELEQRVTGMSERSRWKRSTRSPAPLFGWLQGPHLPKQVRMLGWLRVC